MAVAPIGRALAGLGKIISRLLAEPQDLLATLVLGNSFANAGIVAMALLLALRATGRCRRFWRRCWR